MKIFNFTLLLLFQSLFTCNESMEKQTLPALTGSAHQLKDNKPGTAGMVFRSGDGGQSWQDISEGLPGVQLEGSHFVNDRGIYVRTGNFIYHSQPGSKMPLWKKEPFPDNHSIISPGRSGMFAYDYHLGQFRQKMNGLDLWLPVYGNFQLKGIIGVFETSAGTVFIICDRGRGLFRSVDNGKNWTEVHRGVWQLAESNGVLLANSINGIIRSTNEGETWETVNTGDGMGVNITPIDGGFAAITYTGEPETRRIRASYDGGKNWQAIDSGLPKGEMISSIIQAGEYFFCGHPDGIYRSGDQGKTWQLVFPSIEGKVFNLFVSDNVVYAIPGDGC